MDYLLPLLCTIAIIFIMMIRLSTRKRRRRDNWVDSDEFQIAKSRVRYNCNEVGLENFMIFLRNYKGGSVHRSYGKIVSQQYSGKEKGDLKGIFYNIILPSGNLSVAKKEEYRKLIISLGVEGVENRPSYETRDARLKNKSTNENDFQRKQVGNQGERTVRNILDKLEDGEYSIINGPVLKCGDETKEYDHIVVCNNGIFVIETKAFGMTDGKPIKAGLFIDKGDKWILRKKQTNKELITPTEQVMAEKKHLEGIIDMPIDVHPILALSNSEIFIKQNIELPYKVLKADELKEYIESINDLITENDRMEILEKIDKSRVN